MILKWKNFSIKTINQLKIIIMKTKIFLAAVAAAAVLTGCEKKQIPVTAGDDGGETAELSICIPLGNQTKAAGTVTAADEDKLNSAQVFVFTGNGVLESSKRATTGNLELVCTRGDKQVAAVVNAPEINDVTSISEFRDKMTYISDNAAKSLLMYGQKWVTVDAASVTATLEVKRFAAKVVIQKITNKMSLAQYKSVPITIKGIYLINVVSGLPFSGDSRAAEWSNKQKNETSSDCLYYEKTSSLSLSYGASDSREHYFYCYSNPTENDNTDTAWSPRHTRLVVETIINGDVFYYPITLPVVAANTVYTIGELTITRPGTAKPDVIDVAGNAAFTITVAPWNNETVDSVTI